MCASKRVDAFIIVVGNITVGATGKTPLVIALSNLLEEHGYTTGIISRGYAGRVGKQPVRVTTNSAPAQVGDEPILLARKTKAPVFVCTDRVAAANALLACQSVDIILSDDGLQHYRLQRDLEIAVVDEQRAVGNGHCLPAGPLRESGRRLDAVDAIIHRTNTRPKKGFWMHYQVGDAISLSDRSKRKELKLFIKDISYLIGSTGNNGRFFTQLKALGINGETHDFPDHHLYSESDLNFAADHPVLMTEKDAVKCEAFAKDNWWQVPLLTHLAPEFEYWLLEKLNAKIQKERK